MNNKKNVLIFDATIQNTKNNSEKECPFCKINKLEKILDKHGSMTWVENKYQTLTNVYQTVVIESNNHDGDFDIYSLQECVTIIKTLLYWWEEMTKSDKYCSVGMYRNFGYLSGGSQRHPHTQIVGFKKRDYFNNLENINFIGYSVCKNNKIEINISEYPITGFLEINIICNSLNNLTDFSDRISKVVKYIKQDYLQGICDSYNLFFYKINHSIICKIIPRFPTSAYVIGYKFSQVLDLTTIKQIAKELNVVISSVL